MIIGLVAIGSAFMLFIFFSETSHAVTFHFLTVVFFRGDKLGEGGGGLLYPLPYSLYIYI